MTGSDASQSAGAAARKVAQPDRTDSAAPKPARVSSGSENMRRCRSAQSAEEAGFRMAECMETSAFVIERSVAALNRPWEGTGNPGTPSIHNVQNWPSKPKCSGFGAQAGAQAYA